MPPLGVEGVGQAHANVLTRHPASGGVAGVYYLPGGRGATAGLTITIGR